MRPDKPLFGKKKLSATAPRLGPALNMSEAQQLEVEGYASAPGDMLSFVDPIDVVAGGLTAPLKSMATTGLRQGLRAGVRTGIAEAVESTAPRAVGMNVVENYGQSQVLDTLGVSLPTELPSYQDQQRVTQATGIAEEIYAKKGRPPT